MTDMLEEFRRAVYDLAEYIPVTLDGEPDADDPDLPRRIRAQARITLADATADTPPGRIAWAAGVICAGHAATFAAGRPAAFNLAVEQAGGSLDGGRMWHATRRGLTVTGPAGDTVVSTTWQQAADLFGPRTIPARLKNAITDALEERHAATTTKPDDWDDWYEGTGWGDSETYRQAKQRWDAADLRCIHLGAQAWALAHPDRAVQPAGQQVEEQVDDLLADLFDDTLLAVFAEAAALTTTRENR